MGLDGAPISPDPMVPVDPERFPLWSSDTAVSLTPSSPLASCCQFQKLLYRIANALEMPLEEVQDSPCQLLDILHVSALIRVVLPISDVIIQLVRTM